MKYDYGNSNDEHYTGEVPDIKLENIKKVPIVLYVGLDDTMSTLINAYYIT